MFDFLSGIITLLVTIIIIALLIALPVMWLWNWLMPVLFDLQEIGFYQALGLSALSSFLFKSSSTKS